ncbi:alpha/beta hydrolase [Nocardioides sp. P86]|uniref:alpha/beta hydrolase n=1 Tax=Nocardioides sp. P86 TaxID=2939569 RepID=UPI00203CF8D9|nr:alpha/beta fold hydrolase [Nocardioides sp. P86]MCM3515597.1 lysophospholipase [Nocardioides sp. P86]
MRHDLTIPSHGTSLAAWHVPATTDAWAGPAGRPVVVMAHGFGCTRDSGLLPFAERFAAAGADVVLFDYRGFGASAGEPRTLVDHRRHREDYAAVVAHVRGLPGLDPERVVLWGSSYSGGHVVAVAADDPRIAAVVSQGAAMDGLAAVREILRYAGPRQLLRLTGHALRDAAGHALGRPDHRIAVVGEPGSLAAITSHDGVDGYAAIAGPGFRNDTPARAILPIATNRPVARARRLRMPLFLLVAADDTIAPPAAVERVAERARGRVVVERLDVGHFDIYLGEPFERSVAAQVEFLGSVVGR